MSTFIMIYSKTGNIIHIIPFLNYILSFSIGILIKLPIKNENNVIFYISLIILFNFLIFYFIHVISLKAILFGFNSGFFIKNMYKFE